MIYNDKILSIIFNNELIVCKKEKIIFDNFDSYSYTEKYRSFILTKGIPYMELSKYLIKNDIDEYIIKNIEQGVSINIKNDIYNPVQSRTKLKMDDKYNDDLLNIILDTIYYKYINTKFYITNENSGCNSLEQLKFIKDHKIKIKKYQGFNLGEFMTYHKYRNMTISIAEMINNIIDKKPQNIIEVVQFIDKYRFTMTQDINRVMDIIISKVRLWFVLKFSVDVQPQEMKVEQKIPKLINYKYKPLFTSFVEAIYETSEGVVKRDNLLVGSVNFYKNVDFIAAYSMGSIMISLEQLEYNESNIDNIIEYLKEGKIYELNENIDNIKNLTYFNYFSLKSPSSTMIHELEHARRRDVSSSYHSNIQEEVIIGEGVRNYDFSQSSNVVLKKCIENGLYDKWKEIFTKKYPK